MIPLNINWEDNSALSHSDKLGKTGYVGTFTTSLFTYSWQGGTDPWVLTSTLPGYSKRSWRFSTDNQAQQFAQRLIAQFIEEIIVLRTASIASA
jgi:hypothetical protein